MNQSSREGDSSKRLIQLSNKIIDQTLKFDDNSSSNTRILTVSPQVMKSK